MDEPIGALLVRDILDNQIRSRERRRLGRVGDVELAFDDDGGVRLASIVLGPEALAGRISARLRRALRRLLGGRFERRVSVDEIDELGPTVRLRGRASAYDLDSGDRWVARNILRFIPGNGGPPE